jgi:AhpD family alkylhydroperoxidase
MRSRKEVTMKLDERIRELIAIGASVGANCKACVEYHLGKGREAGAEGDELAEAVDVGRMVRKGAAAQVDKAVAGVGPAPAAAGASRTSGCCG